MKKRAGTNVPSTSVGEFSKSVGVTSSRIYQLAKLHPLPKPNFIDLKRHKETAYYRITEITQWYSDVKSKGTKNVTDTRLRSA